MPKVSVVIPVYKAECYIEKCVRSLMEQTLNSMEFVFINDATPDDSMRILADVISDYPERAGQIVIIDNKENKGTAYVRTQGIQAAQGDYVAWCDADDWCEADMFEKMWQYSDGGTVDIVTCNYYIEKCIQKEVKNVDAIDNPHLYVKFLYKQKYCLSEPLWNKMIRRKILIDNDIYPFEGVNFGEDFNMVIRMYYYSLKCKLVSEPLYHYRLSNCSSMTKTAIPWSCQKANIDKVALFLESFKDKDLSLSASFVKYCSKMQFRNLFNTEREWFTTYEECHRNILAYTSIPLLNRIVMFIVYSNYHLFDFYNRITVWRKY